MRREKGITLIALVITIVVLLILAAVSITALTDEDKGVVTKAKQAASKTEDSTEAEKDEIDGILEYTENNGNSNTKLYYNKALRLDPSQEDVLHNLAIAEAKTKDRVGEETTFFLAEWMRALRNTMSCTAWSVLSLVAFALFLAFALLFLLASPIKVRKAGFFCALCAVVLFVATTSFAISSRNDILTHDEAIVLSSAISVKSSPDRSATDLFVLHEGTKVRIVSEVDEWCEVVLADGKKGWLQKNDIEEI